MNSHEQDARPANPTNPYAPPTPSGSPAVSPGTLRAAPASLRFWTLIIDYFGMMVFSTVLGIVIGIVAALGGHEGWFEEGPGFIFGIGAMLAYYIIFEATLGRTPGKLIVGTRVVDLNGNQPAFKQIVIRTFVRLVPFEPFSCLGDDGGWHDDWSETRVVRTRGQAEPEKPS